MTKPEIDAGYDPDELIETGVGIGEEMAAAQLREELSERLQDELGFQPDEVEALFDPAPKKHKKGKVKHCSSKQWEKMPQICQGRRYDPAPKKAMHKHPSKDYRGVHINWRPVSEHMRRTYDPTPPKRQYVKKAKTMLDGLYGKAEPYIPIAAGALSFYSLYNDRLEELKAAGKTNKDGTPVATVVDALMYDINNFSANGGLAAIPDRLKASWKAILGGVVGGMVVKEVGKGSRKYSRYARTAGDSLTAIGVSYLLKAVLDPPTTQAPMRQVTASNTVRVLTSPAPLQLQPAQQTIAPQMTGVTGIVNPY